MASNDKASGPADESLEGSWSPRRTKGKAAAKAADDGKSGASPDPEVLAAEIERTREDLAETLDAIADKVSPKKVAARTRKKVGDAVKEGAHDAAEAVKGTAHDAAEVVKGGVAAVKEKVGDEDAPRSPLTPATSVEVGSAAPVGAPGPVAGTPTYTATLPPPAPSRVPVFAGAAAALAVLLLLRRRRRR